MKKYFAIYICALTFIGGCSDKIDGSSLVSYEKSLGKISEKLSSEDRKKLGEDIALASNSLQNMTDSQKASAMFDSKYLMELSRKDLDGKSAEDIHKMAEITRGKNMESKSIGIKAAISKLENSLLNETEVGKNLERIKVDAGKGVFVERPSEYSNKISAGWDYSVTINNGSPFTLSRIGFAIAEAKPASFAYQFQNIDPPLRPGETRSINFTYAFIPPNGSIEMPDSQTALPDVDFKRGKVELVDDDITKSLQLQKYTRGEAGYESIKIVIGDESKSKSIRDEIAKSQNNLNELLASMSNRTK